jgi:hypothetical protein
MSVSGPGMPALEKTGRESRYTGYNRAPQPPPPNHQEGTAASGPLSLSPLCVYAYTIGVAFAWTVVPGAAALLTTTISMGNLVPLIHWPAPIHA